MRAPETIETTEIQFASIVHGFDLGTNGHREPSERTRFPSQCSAERSYGRTCRAVPRLVIMNRKTEKRRQFTLREKLKILQKVDSGKKKNEVAKEFGIAPSTLSTILKDRKKIQNVVKDGTLGPQRKKIRSALHDDIDKVTYSWLQDMRAQGIPLNGPTIREKALEFAKLLEIQTFQASAGWLNRFKERYGVSCRLLSGKELPKLKITVKTEVDDENSMPQIPKVSLSEAMDGINKIRDYLSSHDVPEGVFEKICDVENVIMTVAEKNVRS